MDAFRSDWEPAPRRAPPSTTLLAVGDVHGCAAHLHGMEALLADLTAAAEVAGRRCEIVLLGDYTDRGPSSLGVLRQLSGLRDRLGVPLHLLLGNHDQMLVACLADRPDPEILELWQLNGGTTVLAECGMGPGEIERMSPEAIAQQLRDRLGPELVALLHGLEPGWAAGGYLFVHGGVHPTRPLATQSALDAIWMREPFLSGVGWSHPFAVVHGHTPLGPDVRGHRIGVDSGCFHTGALAAVELVDDRLRFHVVTDLTNAAILASQLPSAQQRRFEPAGKREPRP